jgi:hypothetical protein
MSCLPAAASYPVEGLGWGTRIGVGLCRRFATWLQPGMWLELPASPFEDSGEISLFSRPTQVTALFRSHTTAPPHDVGCQRTMALAVPAVVKSPV